MREVDSLKKILIITSFLTGAGHQSITEALTEQFDRMPEVRYQVVEGFELVGRVGPRLAGFYGSMIRETPNLYDRQWKFTDTHWSHLSFYSRFCVHRFEGILRDFSPDLILTVHSLFNTAVSEMLETLGKDIPLVCLQADPVTIHRSWCNPKACRTICPTREAYEASLQYGLPPEKVVQMGFPVRQRFCEAARAGAGKAYDPNLPPRCLMIGGGEGSGGLEPYSEALLAHTDAFLTVICGRNKKARARLEEKKGEYGERLRVLGFVRDVEREMLQSDLLITRGSPNVLFEAVTVGLPLVMVSGMPQQEKGNPGLMLAHGLGVVCDSPEELPRVLQGLFDGGAAGLAAIRRAQQDYRSLDTAENIARYVAELE